MAYHLPRQSGRTFSSPIQTVGPPFWLTNQSVDNINVEEYDEVRQEFMTIMCAEEPQDSSQSLLRDQEGDPLRLSEILEQAWATGTFWYSMTLSSPTGLFRVFYEHIQSLLSK